MFRNNILCIIATLFFGGCAWVADPASSSSATNGLRINEVLTANNTGILDASGNREAWIELYNAGDTAIDLQNYTLSDNPDKPLKWQSGSYFVNPGEYCLLFASGNDITAIPDTQPPYVIATDIVGSWSDGEMTGDAQGLSYAGPWQFPGRIGRTVGGVTAISAQLYLGDALDKIGWEGQTVVDVNVKNPELVDFSCYNELALRGYIDAGKKLAVSFNQPNWKTQAEQERYFSGPKIDIVGTGEVDGVYRIPLNDEEYNSVVNSASFCGLFFESRAVADTLHFTFASMSLVNSRNRLHTGFKIDKSLPCDIVLCRNGDVVDHVSVPSLKSDQSWGRNADNPSVFGYCAVPTPEGANHGGARSVVTPSTSIVTRGGFYPAPVSVAIAGPSGAIIRYTTDGSVPTAASRIYSAPILVTSNTTLRSAAFRNNEMASDVATESFFVGEKTEMPIVSLIVDSMGLFDPDTGIYMPGPHASVTFPYYGGNFWDKNREIAAHVQFYEPGGKPAFSQGIGLKIHGGWSRGADKKPFSLVFDDQYGTEGLSYPIFPDHPELRSFKSLILRQGGDHADDVIFFDALHGALIDGRDVDYQKVRPSILYINGKYWGIYNIREKISRQYYATNHGVDPDNISLVEDAGNVLSGSADAYIRLLEYLKLNGAADSADYAYVKTQMDIENYIDYMATEIYLANTDWPANNCKWWRSNLPGGKWRWTLFDTDCGETAANPSDFDMLAFITNTDGTDYPNGSQFTFLFRTLLTNSEFKASFINRCATLLATNFSPEHYRTEFDRLKGLYGNETVRDFARWNIDPADREATLESMLEFGDSRPALLRQNMLNHFGLGALASLHLQSTRGSLYVNGLDVLSADFTGIYFTGCPVTVELRNAPGFTGWSDGVSGSLRVVTLSGDTGLTAQFE